MCGQMAHLLRSARAAIVVPKDMCSEARNPCLLLFHRALRKQLVAQSGRSLKRAKFRESCTHFTFGGGQRQVTISSTFIFFSVSIHSLQISPMGFWIVFVFVTCTPSLLPTKQSQLTSLLFQSLCCNSAPQLILFNTPDLFERVFFCLPKKSQMKSKR